MAKVTVLRGYSGSGKSYYSNQQDALVVSRDHIRQQITHHPSKIVLDNDGEQLVTKLETAQIEAALKAGVNVISDNTNLRAKFARRYIDLAVQYGAEWEVKDFLVDAETCKDRNSLRVTPVPQRVIEDQARRFPLGTWPVLEPSTPKVSWEPYVPDISLRPAIAVDLDGTLAHMTNRGPYDTDRYRDDALDEVIWEVVDTFSRAGYAILVVTGRDERFRRDCADWLELNGVPWDGLIMRPEGDTRNDALVKSELLDNFIAPYYNLVLALDDRDRVVDAWRARGVKCLQVERGNF